MSFAILKREILRLTNQNAVDLQVAKDRAKVTVIATVADAEAVLRVLTKPRRITPPTPRWIKDRYNEAHKLWQTTNCPQAIQDHGWTAPPFPKIHTSNGLTTFILNMITWCGCRATRVNTMGRNIKGKWIKGATRPGSADVSSTLRGRSVMWEVKAGKDQPSERQLREQERERKAGGEYYFVHGAEEFFHYFDALMHG